ncbi:MAG: HlyD family efflux transporter periplasmic adaptor subunit [Candidatus Sumerlaeia bacterium]|nr:HlyD family efflux transporter periplasmic adaptor subunit [Candidatus Sumerlaeia bacterium]
MRRSPLLSIGLPILGVASLAIGVVLVGLGKPKVNASEPSITPVTSPAAAGKESTRSYIGAVGVVEPDSELISIGTPRSGIVQEVYAKLGMIVNVGDPLFKIDDRTASALVGTRQREFEQAKAQLEELKAQIPIRRAQMNEAAARVEATKAQIASAEAEILRAVAEQSETQNQLRMGEILFEKDALAEEEVIRRRNLNNQANARVQSAKAQKQLAVAEAKSAEAEFEERRASLELLEERNGGPGASLRAQQAEVDSRGSALEAATVEYQLLTVRAPIFGTVLQRNVRVGEFAQAGTASESLMVIGSLGTRMLRIQIDEADLPRFQEESAASASPRGRAANRYNLVFNRIEPLIRPKTELGSNATELVDTRVLEVVYAFQLNAELPPPYFGQQFDVFIDATPRN